jgi:nucleotide-binding universal stress UspA family protein
MFSKILVALDGSPTSENALALAVDLATHYQADLTALSVAQIPEVVGMIDEVDELRRAAEEQYRMIGDKAAQFARSKGIALRSVVVRGHAADAIVHYAENEAMNLVVIGQHGHSRITRFFMGSTCDRVSEHSHCSVMIVK